MHLVGAKSKGGAEAKTKLILEAANARGIKVQARAPRLAGEREQDLARLRRLNAEDTKLFGQLQDDAFLRMNQPRRTIEERTGVHGFIGDVKPWTRDDLEHLVLKQFQDYQRFQARLSTEYILKNDLATLRAQDPQVYEQLIHRINSTYGIQGKFSQAINKATDKLLAPALGRNSADKITGTANKLMFRLELGFANMGYNLANLFTPALVAMPELVRLSTTHPSRNLMYYTYYPLIGEKTVKPLGIPDVFKIAREAFKKMGSPDEVLWTHFDRGAREGVWGPRFIEEFVGQKSQRDSAQKGVLNGDEPFSRWLGSVSDAIPSLTEKFSRGYSFALGHTYFKNVMGITDDEALYQLSKQFVERTNFLYSIGDRARIITGPFGAPLGLFKNWIMHYISWMMEYTGEGVMRGNWAPLLWMTGTSTAIGGLGALPMYGAADTVSQWFTDKSAMQNLYSAFGGTTREGPGSLSDAVFYGIPGFLGFSIQNQVALPGSDPGQDAARMVFPGPCDGRKHFRKTPRGA